MDTLVRWGGGAMLVRDGGNDNDHGVDDLAME